MNFRLNGAGANIKKSEQSERSLKDLKKLNLKLVVIAQALHVSSTTWASRVESRFPRFRPGPSQYHAHRGGECSLFTGNRS